MGNDTPGVFPVGTVGRAYTDLGFEPVPAGMHVPGLGFEPTLKRVDTVSGERRTTYLGFDPDALVRHPADASPVDQDADRKFFALRQAGYTGPIDQHGNKVTTGPAADILRDLAAYTPTKSPTATSTAAAVGGGVSAFEKGNRMQVTELESLEAVRGEARSAVAMSESLTETVTAIKDWATGLADRWSGTAWGTADLDAAVAGVGEAAATLAGGEAVGEALAAIEDAVKRAEALGEVANEIAARGAVDPFKAG